MRFSEQTEAENPHFQKFWQMSFRQTGKSAWNQALAIFPRSPMPFVWSVRKNILLGGRDIQKAESLAKALSLTELEHKRADRLSGGETARMAMARLMMGTYDVVILDEPTAAMDMETTAAAETLIQSYVRQTNCILILVTHSLQQARRIADEAMFFQKGEVLEYGPAESLLYSPHVWN